MKNAEMIEKITMDVEGKFWTRQDEMVEELESLGYEVEELDADTLAIVNLQDDDEEDETEYILHVGHANRTMWITEVE